MFLNNNKRNISYNIEVEHKVSSLIDTKEEEKKDVISLNVFKTNLNTEKKGLQGSKVVTHH